MCGPQGSSQQLGNGSSADAFGRLRVSENHLLLSSQLNYDLLPMVWESELTLGGTVTHLPAHSSAELLLPVTSGAKVIRQTKRYWLYRAAQSQQIMATFAEGDQVANVRKRIGYFDDNDGIFLEITATEIAVVLRSSTSGAPVDTRVTQANWGMDKLDGSGPSGKVLDITKAQIFVIDFQWLGVGDVRVGFDIAEKLTYVHTFANGNSKDTVYMKTGSLPCRYEIENTAASAGAKLHQICTSVVREGGAEEEGILTTVSSALSTQEATTTPASMISIRLRSTHIRAFLKLLNIQLMNETNAKMRWRAVLNPTLTGALTWANAGPASEVSLTMLPYTAASGHVIGQGFVASQGNDKGSLIAGVGLASILGVAATKAGVSDIVSLIVESDSGTPQKLSCALQYVEMF